MTYLRYNYEMKFGHITHSLTTAFGQFLRLVADGLTPDSDSPAGDRPQLDGTDLMGDYNFRTDRLDCGVDPYGWYEDDD